MAFIKFIADLWGTLDGHKTEIGSFILLIATLLGYADNSFNLHYAWVDGAISFLQQVGAWLGAVGIVHAVAKSVPNTTKPTQ